jgi:hypothetical protein
MKTATSGYSKGGNDFLGGTASRLQDAQLELCLDPIHVKIGNTQCADKNGRLGQNHVMPSSIILEDQNHALRQLRPAAAIHQLSETQHRAVGMQKRSMSSVLSFGNSWLETDLTIDLRASN